MVHLLLIITKLNKFDTEEDLVDYLRDVGGLELHRISDILSNYNSVKDDFTNGRTIGEIPLDYLENRKLGIREYDDDGNKVYDTEEMTREFETELGYLINNQILDKLERNK